MLLWMQVHKKKKKKLLEAVFNSLVEYPEMEWLNHMVILF